MEKLIDKIESLKKGEIGKLVNDRIKEFKDIDKKSTNELFNEMCFCILTANFNAEKSIKIQNEIGECFSNDSEEDLAKKLQELGHRFPNMRASYISESRNCKDMLKRVVESLKNDELREWLVKNVK